MKLLLAYYMANVKLNQSAIKCMSDTIGKLNQEYFFFEKQICHIKTQKKEYEEREGKKKDAIFEAF